MNYDFPGYPDNSLTRTRYDRPYSTSRDYRETFAEMVDPVASVDPPDDPEDDDLDDDDDFDEELDGIDEDNDDPDEDDLEEVLQYTPAVSNDI